MAHLVSLDNKAHRHLRIDRDKVDAAGGTLNMVPVVVSEFLKLVVQYPIAFTKDKDTGRFTCVALFGFHEQENLFAKDGRWDAIYIPLQVSRQPFFLGKESEDYILCIDVEHQSVDPEHGEPIFDADGRETAYLESVKEGLAELLNGEQPTRHFADTLARLNLLVPMQLEITFDNGESTRVEGLYTVDEARLEALDGNAIATLHAQRQLGPIYTMLASLGHIYAMIDRRNQHAAQRA